MKVQAGITALAVGIGVFALACEQAPTTLDAPDVRAAVKLVDFNEIVPVAVFMNNPCTPFELILFTGTDHVIRKIWDNGHYKIHFQFNLKGTDAAGVAYKVNDAINEQGQGPFPVSFTNVYKMVSATNVDNFLFKAHVTINANGVVTVNRSAGKCVG